MSIQHKSMKGASYRERAIFQHQRGCQATIDKLAISIIVIMITIIIIIHIVIIIIHIIIIVIIITIINRFTFQELARCRTIIN